MEAQQLTAEESNEVTGLTEDTNEKANELLPEGSALLRYTSDSNPVEARTQGHPDQSEE